MSLQGQRRVHIIGIGGAGMGAIAHLLLDRGLAVSGSDLRDSPTAAALRDRGAIVHVGHRAENLAGEAPPDLVVHSSAVPADNPEIVAARERGLPTLKRPELLTLLSAERPTLAIAGTHGKTTTTAMAALALDAAGLDPAYIVGGDVPGLPHPGRDGRGGWLVIEADEYDRTFLALRPTVAILTNVEPDHLDFFGSEAAVEAVFADFLALVPPDGLVVVCADSPAALALARRHSRARLVSYGSADADYVAGDFQVDPAAGAFRFGVCHGDERLAEVALGVPGRHNALNALAVIAACREALGLPLEVVLPALAAFRGARRRFERRGNVAGVEVVDDYAHHPTELRATLEAARSLGPARLVCLFQPHTLDRTRRFAAGFAEALRLADRAVVVDPFRAAGRESDRDASGRHETSAARIAALAGPEARYLPKTAWAVDHLARELRAGDLLIVAGAGDIVCATPALLARLGQRCGGGSTAAPGAQAGPPVAVQGAEDCAGRGRAWTAPQAAAVEARLGRAPRRDEPLARHTTSRVGGVADLLFAAGTKDELREAVLAARAAGLPYLLLGAGSNVVIADRGVRGLVILSAAKAWRLEPEGDYAVLWAEAGSMMPKLARETARRGWGGLEWGTGVPGTVGGSVVGNAGAYGGAVADNLIDCEVLTPGGEVVILPAEALRFEYRSSALKDAVGWTVLAARFRLTPLAGDELARRMAESVHHRKTRQPALPSSGSVFKNPPGDYAGRLIEAAGLKGLAIGGAEVSQTHANFIVNRGGAIAADIAQLIETVRERVRREFGVTLELEIRLLGEW